MEEMTLIQSLDESIKIAGKNNQQGALFMLIVLKGALLDEKIGNIIPIMQIERIAILFGKQKALNEKYEEVYLKNVEPLGTA